MANDDIEIAQVRVLHTVAELGSFTAAARRLHVTQQTVSVAVRRLEQRVGARLLDRDSRSVTLTAAGAAFLGHAAPALVAIDDAVAAARHQARARTEVLHVGHMPAAALELTDPILERFRARRPGARVELTYYEYDDPAAGTLTGETDLGIVRPPLGGDALRICRLFDDPLVAALPATHPLATRAAVGPDELVDTPLVRVASPDKSWNAFWGGEELWGRDAPRTAVEAATATAWVEAIALGQGFGVTTAGLARYHPRPGLVVVPLLTATTGTVALAWRRSGPHPLVAAFVEAARAVVAEVEGWTADGRPRHRDPSATAPVT